MSVQISPFGSLPSGESVEKYTLIGAGGLSVDIITYGATLQRIQFHGRDMILGFDTLEQYIGNPGYLGAAVGRYANRIAGGRFMLDGTEYAVGINERGCTCLHGGKKGFSYHVWHAAVKSNGNEPSVTFSRLSPNGEEGFPGNMVVSVTYTVTTQNELRLEYTAKADAPTVLNLTNHAYFTLGAESCNDILLWIDSDATNEVDKNLIPTGVWLDVAGTPFDFREMKAIGQDIGIENEQLAIGGGYDCNYLLNGEGYRHTMTACSPIGVRMTCHTDQPCGQLYSANMLDEQPGLDGKPMGFRAAFCFETQHCADSPHHPSFPSTRLEAGDEFRSITAYRFEMMDV